MYFYSFLHFEHSSGCYLIKYVGVDSCYMLTEYMMILLSWHLIERYMDRMMLSAMHKCINGAGLNTAIIS